MRIWLVVVILMKMNEGVMCYVVMILFVCWLLCFFCE